MQFEFSEWELSKLSQIAAGNALTYISHFSGPGLLSMEEFNTMERWRKLSDKLDGSTFKPMKPEHGTVREWDASKAEPA